MTGTSYWTRGRCAAPSVCRSSLWRRMAGRRSILWCKRGSGQAVIAGETITIMVRSMAEEACTPERAQADEQMIVALSQVTTWSLRSDVLTFNGGATLRFRAASN